jgi:glucosamine-6-phosphate deaminase
MKTSFAITTRERCCAPSEPWDGAEGGLRLRVLPTVAEVARQAALMVLEACLSDPRRPLGLATGRTMMPLYAALAAAVAQQSPGDQDVLRRQWCSFNLDEYVGLGPQSPGSFAAEMDRHLCQPLAVDPNQVHLPNGLAADPDAEALRYSQSLRRAGGVGLQLLGLGLNGHVGFNEPPCPADSQARCVELCSSTRQANAGGFGGDWQQVPALAITLGLAEILEAQRILLVVTGAAKAQVLQRLLHSQPSEALPASWLWQHPSVFILADAAALRS